jgi:DNA-binding NtrC family response regulator
MTELKNHHPARANGPLDLSAVLPFIIDQDDKLEWPAIERKMIVDAIVKAQGRRNKAAVLLGWSRSRLYRKMAQYGIET